MISNSIIYIKQTKTKMETIKIFKLNTEVVVINGLAKKNKEVTLKVGTKCVMIDDSINPKGGIFINAYIKKDKCKMFYLANYSELLKNNLIEKI